VEVNVKIQDVFEERCRVNTDMFHHLPYLRRTVVDLGARQVIELGVRTGESTVAFLTGLEETGGELWSCDIQHPLDIKNHVFGNPIADHVWGNFDNWTFTLGNDLEMVAEAPEQCDVLFIDAEHTYDHVLAELEAYGPRVRAGGVILLHDSYDLEPKNEVVQAISKYRWGREDSLPLTNEPGCYGLATIRVIGEKPQ